MRYLNPRHSTLQFNTITDTDILCIELLCLTEQCTHYVNKKTGVEIVWDQQHSDWLNE